MEAAWVPTTDDPEEEVEMSKGGDGDHHWKHVLWLRAHKARFDKLAMAAIIVQGTSAGLAYPLLHVGSRLPASQAPRVTSFLTHVQRQIASIQEALRTSTLSFGVRLEYFGSTTIRGSRRRHFGILRQAAEGAGALFPRCAETSNLNVPPLRPRFAVELAVPYKSVPSQRP
ncbi:hypothetical protein DL765_006538 [Monosporascus sp. GIB2]|nr:hypothetical protein DL765_006538 [Monosporascus sp. GIB2]